ncbi:immunoglobulin-like domain-containing protein [Rossellomorea sp. NPDC077527]|uniref:immunoglobulin-like domain-containing protein n=1 Tax=Rossellomorea sp. NPDC077527 TaxID=3364510 RepID=UPI0037C52BDC
MELSFLSKRTTIWDYYGKIQKTRMVVSRLKKLIMIIVLTIVVTIYVSVGSNAHYPSQSGEKGKEAFNPETYSKVDIYNQTEYVYNENKYNRLATIIRETPEGLISPGENASIIIAEKSISKGQSVNVQIVERDKNWKKVKEVSNVRYDPDDSFYPVEIPKKEDVFYTLNIELVNPEGKSIGQTVYPLFAPKREINAKFSTSKHTLESKEILPLLIENWGPTPLTFGEEYVLQKKSLLSWKNMNKGQAFSTGGYEVGVNKDNKQEINLESFRLTKGRYRVVKEFSAAMLGIEKKLAVEFEVD